MSALTSRLKPFGIALAILAMGPSLRAGNVVTYTNSSKYDWTLTTVPEGQRPKDSPEVGKIYFTAPDGKTTVLGATYDKDPKTEESIFLPHNTKFTVEYSRHNKALFHLFTLTCTDANAPVNSVTVQTLPPPSWSWPTHCVPGYRDLLLHAPWDRK